MAQGAPLAVFGPKIGTKGAETGLTAWAAIVPIAPFIDFRPVARIQQGLVPRNSRPRRLIQHVQFFSLVGLIDAKAGYTLVLKNPVRSHVSAGCGSALVVGRIAKCLGAECGRAARRGSETVLGGRICQGG